MRVTTALVRSIRVAALIGAAVALGACSKPQEQAAQSVPASAPADSTPAPGPTGDAAASDSIVIVDSGSTNTIGYRITVSASGEASYVSGAGPGHATLPADLYTHLKSDVAGAGPLSKLPAGSCMKPASFGTAVKISLGGETSPDLSCAGNDAATKLKDDIDAVVAFLKLEDVPRSRGKELPPQ